MLRRVRQWFSSRIRGRERPFSPEDLLRHISEEWPEDAPLRLPPRASGEERPLGYEERTYARWLLRDLKGMVASRLPGTRVSIEGKGVHWSCTAKRRPRRCAIGCFCYEHEGNRPEYAIDFMGGDEQIASGRTSSRKEAVSAVALWLAGGELDDLHRVPFVDRHKRSLTSLLEHATERCPELEQIGRELESSWGDEDVFCGLTFRDGDRECEVGGGEPPFVVSFRWDETDLFQLETAEQDLVAQVAKRWVCDHAMPSELQSEVPSLETGELARYYEEGRPVVGEFRLSWDQIERFYQQLPFAICGPVLELIAAMRRAGYDEILRAGQSLSTLIVSRSRRHGLRNGQPYVAFSFREANIDVSIASVHHAGHGKLLRSGRPLPSDAMARLEQPGRDGEQEPSAPEAGMDVYVRGQPVLSCPRIAFTPEVDAILRQLAEKGID